MMGRAVSDDNAEALISNVFEKAAPAKCGLLAFQPALLPNPAEEF
jgi:hypothetical protein